MGRSICYALFFHLEISYNLYMNEKEIKKVIKFKKESLACLINNLGENHPEAINTEYELAKIYIDNDDYKNAYKHLKNVQFHFKNNKSKVYNNIKESFDYNFFLVCHFLKKYEEICNNAFSFLKRISDLDYYDDDMIFIINIIAQSYYHCDKEDLSRSLYKMIYNYVDANYDTFPVPKFVPLTVINYVGFLNSQNEVEEAQAILASWRDSIDDLIAENFDDDESDEYPPVNAPLIDLLTNRLFCDYVSSLLDGDIYFEFFEIFGSDDFQNFLHDFFDENLIEEIPTEDKHLDFPKKF